ncbi:MAG TPA: CPBP family intramembrane metalloprotease [Bacteroidales bacterium]|nr:CPBP family intramembrane metalloprotease [Bacteroidales bacterium]HSA42557.1 CPBP family intramembrane metalloprotease [Bacteroidales bacterium]
MHLKNRWIVSLLLVVVFLLVHYLHYPFAYLIFGTERYNSLPPEARLLMVQGTGLVICLLATYLLAGRSFQNALHLLGLRRGLLQALAAAFLCCLPMLAGYWFVTDKQVSLSLSGIATGALWAGFNEEIVFRGFLLGLLVRLAGWNFWAALLLPSAVFGLGHLYQAASPAEALQVFLFTATASVGFALFYLMWGWNLWFPLFMHVLMNLSWVLYDAGENVLGNASLNVPRLITIVLAILASLLVMRKNRQPWKSLLSGKITVNQD